MFSFSASARAASRGLAGGLSIAAALATFAAATPALAHPRHDCRGDDYDVVGVERAIVGHNLERTVATVQVGDDPINRFPVFHVRKSGHGQGSRGAILLLPPISAGFENYESTHTGEYSDSFVAYFASRGYDVWGLSQRTAGLTAGDCESGAVDCSAMEDWGLDTLVEDIAFVREQIGAWHPGRRPVIGGVSLGSIAAMAVLDANPDDYAGAILLEGTLFNADPGERAIAQGFCSQFTGAVAAGAYYDGQQLSGMKAVAGLATFDPSSPSPIPAFAGLTNHQAFVAAMSTPQTGPITPRPGYYFLDGSPAQDTFFFADDALARNNMATFADYVALPMVRDIDCSLAGDRTFSANLGKFRGSIYLSAGEHGFGRAMLDTLALMPKAHTAVSFYPSYGHMDYFFNVNHRVIMEGAIADWLARSVQGF
jgi:pimeloyl-ACP methyl ester carboxylesterase